MHWKYKCSKTAIAIIGAVAILQYGIAIADPVTGLNTFSPGQAATAASVNDNFNAVKSAVDDNDARVTTNSGNIGTNATNIADNFSLINDNATAITDNFNNLDQRLAGFETDFSGYGVPFSTDGAPKNVVVLAQDLGGGNTAYSIRSRYQNSTEQVSIDGTPTVRPFIANYAWVQTDSLGDVISISNYIETPDTASYDIYNIEESIFDVVTLAKTVTDDTKRENWICSGNIVLICYAYITLSINGNFFDLYDYSSNRQLGGPITINNLTFDDVRLESYTGTQNQFRIRARDIGTIYRRTRQSDGGVSVQSVIYYQANGTSGGSLAGTPFDTGQLLDGLFF